VSVLLISNYVEELQGVKKPRVFVSPAQSVSIRSVPTKVCWACYQIPLQAGCDVPLQRASFIAHTLRAAACTAVHLLLTAGQSGADLCLLLPLQLSFLPAVSFCTDAGVWENSINCDPAGRKGNKAQTPAKP
jgi:hypothetical protein